MKLTDEMIIAGAGVILGELGGLSDAILDPEKLAADVYRAMRRAHKADRGDTWIIQADGTVTAP